jgi:hypothetical protein
MRIRLAVPEEGLSDAERKHALDAALEAVTRTAVPLVQRGKVPSAAVAIRANRVRWRPEPPGDEHFDLPTEVMRRGHGDCDDLAPWHAASLRASGIDRGARAVVRKSGPMRWHAVVERSDGTTDDPSRSAGMGSGVSGPGVGAAAPICQPMHCERLAVAAYPTARGMLARVDVPDMEMPWSWAGLHHHPNVRHAVVGAIRAARGVAGEGMDDIDELRLDALEDLLSGAHPSELAEALHDENEEFADAVLGEAMVVGSFLDSLAKPFKSVAHALSPVLHATPFGAALDLAQGGNVLDSLMRMTPMGMAQQGFGMARGMMPGGGAPGAMPQMPVQQMHDFVSQNRWAAPIMQQLGPMAGMALAPFLGPLGPMAGSMLTNYIAPGGGGGGVSLPPGMPFQPFSGGPQLMQF